MAESISIGMFGPVAVGKTSLTVQYVSNTFSEMHDPTLEDYFETSKNIDNKVSKMTIYDTGGQELAYTLLNDTIKDSEGFLIVYSVTDPESYEKVKGIHSKIKSSKEGLKEVPIVLVANKIDITRMVSTEQGQSLAKELGCKYMETSAKTRVNVEQAFAEVVKEVRRIRIAAAAPSSPSSPNPSSPSSKGKKSCKQQ
ncbi:Ras-like protein [Acrasis kona]|uniref:Ras-like protein n=1 Tax=Acrasis kona TaxID=1008807 RepID=A0AAW2ZRL2_9EUKA